MAALLGRGSLQQNPCTFDPVVDLSLTEYFFDDTTEYVDGVSNGYTSVKDMIATNKKYAHDGTFDIDLAFGDKGDLYPTNANHDGCPE